MNKTRVVVPVKGVKVDEDFCSWGWDMQPEIKIKEPTMTMSLSCFMISLRYPYIKGLLQNKRFTLNGKNHDVNDIHIDLNDTY